MVGYVIETGGFGNGWLNPGDEFYLHQDISQQIGERLTFNGTVEWVQRCTPNRRIGCQLDPSDFGYH